MILFLQTFLQITANDTTKNVVKAIKQIVDTVKHTANTTHQVVQDTSTSYVEPSDIRGLIWNIIASVAFVIISGLSVWAWRRMRKNSWKKPYIAKLKIDLDHDLNSNNLFQNSEHLKGTVVEVSLTTENGSKVFKNMTELLKAYKDKSVVILGEPGAGKSFMINRFIENSIKDTGFLPPKNLFVLVKLIDVEQSDLVKQISANLSVSKTIEVDEIKTLLRKGRITLFLDGYNEISGSADFATKFESNLKLFIKTYPKCQIIATCRYGEFPAYLRNSFEVIAEACSLKPEEVDNYLTQILSQKNAKKIDSKTKDLCRNPLMLSMVLFYIHSKGNKVENLPKNKAELYNEYFEIIYKHQDANIPGKFKIDKNVYADILYDFAFNLKNEKFSISKSEFDIWLKEKYKTEYQHKDELLKLVPLKTTGADESIVSFMHQSFQEYFTARYLNKQLQTQTISIATLNEYFSNIRWQETIILLSQMMQDATPLIEEIIKDKKNVKAEIWYLATKCLASAKPSQKQKEMANDLLVRSLDNFKYGAAFRYELLFALKEITGICDKNKYKRLIQNAEFWFEKYAHHENEPNDLKHLTFEELIDIVRTSKMEDLLIDAMHTIVKHNLASNIAERKNKFLTELNSKVETDKISDRLKEQILISYGNLKDKSAIPYLTGIVDSDKEGKFHKALALNSLGAIGNEEAVPVLMKYLKDDSAEYRDSAAWALTEIKPQSVVNDLLEILESSVTKKIDQYTIGTTLYALGTIKNQSVVSKMLEWYENLKTCPLYNNDEKAYIIEDFIYALVMLKSPLAKKVLTELLNHADNIVRARAADSLALLDEH